MSSNKGRQQESYLKHLAGESEAGDRFLYCFNAKQELLLL